MFVIVDKILHLDAFSLGEKAKYLEHRGSSCDTGAFGELPLNCQRA
jgi:hypothetical protein